MDVFQIKQLRSFPLLFFALVVHCILLFLLQDKEELFGGLGSFVLLQDGIDAGQLLVVHVVNERHGSFDLIYACLTGRDR